MDSTMPRRPDDDANWGGPREGAGKPRKNPDERKQTLSLTVAGALKRRFDELGEVQKRLVREQLAVALERALSEVESASEP
jgi:hypothetical protein